MRRETVNELEKHKNPFPIKLQDSWFWKIEQKVRMQQNMI